ncbi:tripartite tricarboxylate transporter substrate binding protein [Polynucleobacter paneuropaeus]|nr:tripartite tricarboxylate transporter substrate binding protein [Polynucleobacter paneuropaeus]QWD26304.1 tripartite tricarboxylate transporter substrate binding protein [Polynucleobacter paneuropaeus]QWD28019.1 tripartite tricarboxylate transporter substrate binding protein [Polynucleobacter paneuropaeus]
MYRFSKLTKYLCIATMGLMVTVSHAQTASFPDRPVTIVVPFPPGGGTDAGARLIAQKLSTRWGQSVIIDNKAGASGMVGSEYVSRAKPDGYTLLIGNIGTFSINPSLYKKMPYDPDKAFVPVSMIAELPYFLLVTPSMKANNIKEFIAFAKSNPGAVTYASSGSGSGPHLAGEMFEKATGLDMMHVPYKGGGPAAADVMAGHVNMYFSTVLESIGSVKSGKLKALGTSSLVRSPAMPELPTIAESGVPGFDAASWIGIAAPAGTSPALVDKIAADLKAVISEQDTKQTLIQQGATPMPLTPTAFKARIESDRVRYAKVIKEGNVQVD